MKFEYQELGQTAIQIIDGDRGKNYPNGDDFSSNGYCLFLNAKNVTDEGFSFSERLFISEKKDSLLRKGKLIPRDTILTTRGTVGNTAYFGDDVPYPNMRINSGMVIIRPNPDVFVPEFIYWLFRSRIVQNQILQLRSGTAQPQLPISSMQRIKIPVPTLKVQKVIVDIVGTLQRKIELNQKMNDNLQQQALALFDNRFPYKVINSLPTEWRIGTVGEIIEIHDYKRIPLSGAQRAKMTRRLYPYYGAASLMDYVDEYIFDGKYLLLGEDGTVVDNAGYPILQYVWGQFWVNNHAHVLTGKLGFNVESLYLLFKQTPVKSIVTGAVQPKISQANLRSIQVAIPPEKELLKFNAEVEPLFSLIRLNEEENKALATLRSFLLPKLMSGEIDVSNLQI